jgi:nitrogen regulatory protein P-II 1
MKKIECIVRSERLEELRNELRRHGVGGMTISDVRGFGKETMRPESYLVLPKIKVEVYCTDEQTEELVDAVIRVCRRNEIGDGKIAILPVEDVIRVRTGERSAEAIF